MRIVRDTEILGDERIDVKQGRAERCIKSVVRLIL